MGQGLAIAPDDHFGAGDLLDLQRGVPGKRMIGSHRERIALFEKNVGPIRRLVHYAQDHVDPPALQTGRQIAHASFDDLDAFAPDGTGRPDCSLHPVIGQSRQKADPYQLAGLFNRHRLRRAGKLRLDPSGME